MTAVRAANLAADEVPGIAWSCTQEGRLIRFSAVMPDGVRVAFHHIPETPSPLFDIAEGRQVRTAVRNVAMAWVEGVLR